MNHYTPKDILLILICFACFLAALVLISPKAHGDDALPAVIPNSFDLDSLGVDSRLLPGVPALTQYQNDVGKAKAAYEASIYKAAEELRKKLLAAQEQATKSGDLDKALAIRAAMDKLPRAPKAAAPIPVLSVRERLTGNSFTYDFHNGHRGTLQIRRGDASTPGHQGAMSNKGAAVIISWDNSTQWDIADQGGDLTVTASDGTSKLIPVAASP